MLTDILKVLFNNHFNKLKIEIELYKNESTIWKTQKGIANSGGNLCLHLIGNLNTYIAAALGKTNYSRNRALEFSLKDIPRSILLTKIEETRVAIENTLDSLSQQDLKMEFPLLVFEEKTTTEYMLIHLTTHLAYHLGQINYHRRLVEA